MDFIVDNYFWFIVGGIVVLMIIIGFIAEKTDFGKKPFREKKVDNKEENISNEELVENVEDSESPVVIPETGVSSDFMMEDGLADVELPEEVLEDNIENPEEILGENNEDFSVVEPLEETIEEPMTDLDIPETTIDDKEVVTEVSDVVEEVVAEDSEDDVWKF